MSFLCDFWNEIDHVFLQTVPKDEYPKDIIYWLIQAKGNGDPGAAPSEIALQDDAWTLVVAGRCVRTPYL